MKIYKEPAQPSQINFWASLITLLIWTYVMSFVYAMFISVSPLTYINFIISLAYSVSIGIGAIILGKLFKITQKKNVTLMAVVAASFGIYFSWVAMLYYFIPGNNAAEDYFLAPLLLFEPLTVFEIIAEINRIGFWSIFGITFSGFILTGVWIIEIFTVLFISYKLNKNIETQPFDINSNKWLKKYHLHKEFESFSYLPEFSEKIAQSPFDTLSSLGNGSAYSFGQVSIYHLKDSEICYLSLHNIGRNRDGKSTTTKDVLLLLEISKNNAEQLLQEFKFKKKWFLDF